MATLFAQSKKFQEAVGLLNSIPTTKFPSLLSHILGKLHEKEVLFSATEEDRLCAMMRLGKSDLGVLLDACCFIFEQAAYYGTNAQVLEDHLLQAAVDSDHVRLSVSSSQLPTQI